MFLIRALIIVAVTLASLVYLVQQIFLDNRKENKEYEETLLNLPTKWGGWVGLSDADFHPLIFGKILYSFNGYAIGVGVLVKEHLPAALTADINTKADVQLLDDLSPLCRFMIDFQGQETIITELEDMQLKEKLKPYVDNYSKIKLMIGLQSNAFVLIDNDEGKSDFERIWQETKEGKILEKSKS